MLSEKTYVHEPTGEEMCQRKPQAQAAVTLAGQQHRYLDLKDRCWQVKLMGTIINTLNHQVGANSFTVDC